MKSDLSSHNLTALRLAREQLMEDIITIVEGHDSRESPEYLSTALCDAVCKYFPLSPGPT